MYKKTTKQKTLKTKNNKKNSYIIVDLTFTRRCNYRLLAIELIKFKLLLYYI